MIGLSAISFTLLVASFHVRFWPAELLVSETPLIIVLSFFLLVSGLAMTAATFNQTGIIRQVRPLTIFVTLALILGGYALFYSLNSQSPEKFSSSGRTTLRFATFNKLHSNKKYDLISSYLEEQQVDIVAFQEIKKTELRTISDQADMPYTYSARSVHEKYGSSVGIASRLPIITARAVELGGGYALVRAEVELSDDRRAAFYSAHVTPPFTYDRYVSSYKDIATFAQTIAEDPLPVIAGGDFNTTVFSPKLDDFNKSTAATIKPITTERWPQCSWYGFGAPLCMRIDHIYIPQSADLHNVIISSDLGSDHRAIIAEISL